MNAARIAIVIPCYRVRKHIADVVSKIGHECEKIYVVDDACPDKTGDFVAGYLSDQRIVILYNDKNLGVGGAVMRGYVAALEDGIDIVVKLDGDGQMDPRLIQDLVAPILAGEADYTKGNRFFNLEMIHKMPTLRIFGNAALSFMTKLSSGYWDIFDPTNGFTAIHRDALRHLPLDKISQRYFFESDILFRLNTIRAVVLDIPMDANYGDEVSNLRVSRVLVEFFIKNLRNFAKRVFYNYYLRDMSIASFELPIGVMMIVFGIVYGGINWYEASKIESFTPSGTVMLASLPILVGLQFVLAFISYDITSVPRRPLRRSINNVLKNKGVASE